MLLLLWSVRLFQAAVQNAYVQIISWLILYTLPIFTPPPTHTLVGLRCFLILKGTSLNSVKPRVFPPFFLTVLNVPLFSGDNLQHFLCRLIQWAIIFECRLESRPSSASWVYNISPVWVPENKILFQLFPVSYMTVSKWAVNVLCTFSNLAISLTLKGDVNTLRYFCLHSLSALKTVNSGSVPLVLKVAELRKRRLLCCGP